MRTDPLTHSGPETVEAVLERLQRDHPTAVLSGDWAARRRLGTPAAYRLELIVEREDLDSIESTTGGVTPTEQRGLYALQVQGVDVSLLVASEAYLGKRLRLPVAALAEHARATDDRRALSAEGLFAERMASLLDQPDSRGAERDRGDMVALAAQQGGLDWDQLASLLHETGHWAFDQRQIVMETFGLMAELDGLGRHGTNWLWGWQRQALDAVEGKTASAATESRLQELAQKRREGTQTDEERRQERELQHRQARERQPGPASDYLSQFHPSSEPDLEREP